VAYKSDDTLSVRIYFSDYFGLPPEAIDGYGAFNVSLLNDLPLFIDPFLLFNSTKPAYRQLHDEIIAYVRFLRDKARAGGLTEGELVTWFTFPEIRQNWLGFSLLGNGGSGLNMEFARSLADNLHALFPDFGDAGVTKGSHLEKLTLVSSGIGKDRISDFVTNLIKGYLLEYTQAFARTHLPPRFRRSIPVPKVRFNYATETWATGTFELPYNEEAADYVLLTPKDLLTKDEVWINRHDLSEQFEDIVATVGNAGLRAQINNYFLRVLPEDATAKERAGAITKAILKFPAILDYYIRFKEDHGDEATASSSERVARSDILFVKQIAKFAALLHSTTNFYGLEGNTYDEARARLLFFKDVVENKGGHRLFYDGGQPIRREIDLHILFRLTWFATLSDVTREANDGRGPADFKIARGALDKTIVEFKLASNKKLEDNLRKQAEIYQKASDAQFALKVIFYFSEGEHDKVVKILKKIGLDGSPHVILVDARGDNKPSASNA